MGNQFGKELLMLAQTHRLEKAAFPQTPFHEIRSCDEEIGVNMLVPDVDHHPILDGVVINDITGIRNDGIALRERGNNVRIDEDAVPPDEKEYQHTGEDNDYQRPGQTVSILGHLISYLP